MQSRPLLSSQQVLDCSVSALAPSFPTAQLRLSHSCCRTINLQHLSAGACPIIPSTGQRSTACLSHPGSYLSAVALTTASGSRVEVVAGAASVGFQRVEVDGRPLTVGAAEDAGGAVTVWQSSHEVRLTVGRWTLQLENSDTFLNLRSVLVAGPLNTLSSHGLIGQTWATEMHSGRIPAIEGDVDDYLEADYDLFDSNFLYNRMLV